MSEVKEDGTCCLHQHVQQCSGTQCCSCTKPGSVPTFDLELQHEQEEADVVEKKSAVFHDLLRLSGKYWQNRFNLKMILRASFSNCE